MKLLHLALLLSIGFLGCQKKKRFIKAPPAAQTVQKTQPPHQKPQVVENQTEETIDEILEAPAPPAPTPEPKKTMAAKPVLKPKTLPKVGPPRYSKRKSLYRQALRAVSKKEWKKARNLYLQSCQEGNWEGCHRYGWHQQGLGNIANAIQFYTKSCNHGIARSCNNLGWLAEHLKNYPEAQNYYSWACLKKHKGACQSLKRMQHRAIMTSTIKPNSSAYSH